MIEDNNEYEKAFDELFSKKILYDKDLDEVVAVERVKDKSLFTSFVNSGFNEFSHDKSEPKVDYRLEYVYGYRAYDSRHNLHFISPTQIIYTAASFGIILDRTTNTQTFLYNEVKEFTCLSINPKRTYVAIGQSKIISIWNIEGYQLKSPISKYKTQSIVQYCAWSYDSEYIALIDRLNICVMIVNTGEVILNKQSKGLLYACWSMKEKDYLFATCGLRGIEFWQPDGSSIRGEGEAFCCAVYDDEGTCYAGGFDGLIYVYEESKLAQKLNAHTGIVVCLTWCEDKIVSGGSEGTICISNIDEETQKRIDIEFIPRSIDKLDEYILIGLKDGTICIINESTNNKTIVVKSHSEGEVWGLEVLESGNVLTTGDDNKLMLWSIKERRNKICIPINEKQGDSYQYGLGPLTLFPDNQCSRATSYNSKTNELAIATNSGEVQIRDFNKLNVVKKLLQLDSKWIEVLVYSPDGNYLAIGTHSNTIVIYNTVAYAKRAQFNSHTSPITSIDWTTNSKYMRSCSTLYEMIYFNMVAMVEDINGSVNTKNEEWATETCKVGCNVKGILDKDEVNSINISEDKQLIVVGANDGVINIYKYPCLEGGKAKRLYGHTEHVNRVKFGLNGKYIFSIGGYDKTLMQWKLASK